jgi:hypothetical protein
VDVDHPITIHVNGRAHRITELRVTARRIAQLSGIYSPRRVVVSYSVRTGEPTTYFDLSREILPGDGQRFEVR